MPLKMPSSWRFGGAARALPEEAVGRFSVFAGKIANASNRPKAVLETFKEHVAHALGEHASPSTSADWAQSDLYDLLARAANNAPLLIEAFWLACKELKGKNYSAPNASALNLFLDQNSVGYRLEPPHLREAVALRQLDPLERDSGGAPGPEGYDLIRQIGAGGYGTVHEGKRRNSLADFTFAIKVVDPHPFVTDAAKAEKRFLREIEAIQKLQHRSIIPCVDAGVTPAGQHFLVMPLVEGTDLRIAGSEMAFEERVQALAEVLLGVAYSHKNDVLHRDLKPTNIMIRSSDRQPIIIDFGMAYLLDEADRATLTTSLAGSLGYIPSEVLANPKKRDPRHDVFSCGVILYEILAGKRPVPDNYESLTSIDPTLECLDKVIKTALAPEGQRYPGAADFLHELGTAWPSAARTGGV